MRDKVHKSLFIEYEKKRNRALAEADDKKRQILEKYPELQSIEELIRQTGLAISKAILCKNGDDNTTIDNLNQKLANLKESKQAILNRKGICVTHIEPAFECKLCGDTGYNQENNQVCTCFKQKIINLAYKQANLELMETENFRTFQEEMYSSEQNPERYGIKISPRENILRIKELCLKFVEKYDNPDSKNLLFIGEPGLGKTFLSNCIAKELLDQGKTVIYQTSPRLLDVIMDYKMRFDRQDNFEDEEYNKLFEANLLIIDDLGTEALNQVRLSELFTIINARLLTQKTKGTKTILSTNLPLEELNKFYDDRMMSRLLGEFYICKFVGDDIRIKKARAG